GGRAAVNARATSSISSSIPVRNSSCIEVPQLDQLRLNLSSCLRHAPLHGSLADPKHGGDVLVFVLLALHQEKCIPHFRCQSLDHPCDGPPSLTHPQIFVRRVARGDRAQITHRGTSTQPPPLHPAMIPRSIPGDSQ